MKRWLIRAMAFAAAALITITAVIVFRTWQFSPENSAAVEQASREVDVERAVSNLAAAITFRTISTEPDDPAFAEFRAWLKTTYPRVHSLMELEIVGGGTLLYKGVGSDSQAMPVLLAGHYDVVPVNPGTLEKWTHAPFAGTVTDDHIWGRGALDNKGAVIAMMEAAEALLASEYRPRQTLYFSFGHDEEVGGEQGAAQVVKKFEEAGTKLAWSLDEGSFIFERFFPGVERPVASINVAEKGYMTLVIRARGAGGHSSVPPRETAVGTLARAIIAIENNPVPGNLSGVAGNMFEELAPYLGLSNRVLFANRWLFGPFLEYRLSANPLTDALLRTTTAPTMLSGSIKENVLPSEAIATVNFRLHPRDSGDDVQRHVRDLVSNENVDVEVLNGRITPPSGVASPESEGYLAIAASLRQTFGSIIVVPGMTMAATDSKHYSKIAIDAYRINPFILGQGEGGRIHGINERISIENLEKGVLAYSLLIEQL